MKTPPKALLEPWLITQEGLHRVVDVWAESRRGGQVFESLAKARAELEARPKLEEPGEPVEGTNGTLRIVDSIGVVSIRGTLFRHATLMSNFSGGTSYDALWAGIEAARADPSVKAILLRVDSPGGEANGCGELGDFIAQVAAEKPVWSYVEGQGCSAAAWLAFQALKVYAHRTAMVGSIGVRIEVVDESQLEENMGLRVLDMVSSGAPNKRGKPIDDDVLARIQTKLDDLEEVFVAAVAKGRRVSVDDVYEKFGQGDYMIAGKAAAVGMIDGIDDFNGTLLALRAAVDEQQAQALGLPAPQRSAAAHAAKKGVPAMATKLKTESEPEKKDAKTEGYEPAERADDDADMKDEDGDMLPAKKAKAKTKTKAEDEEPAADDEEMDSDEEMDEEDDKKEGEHDEPDGDEAKARASLTALAGLPRGAKLATVASVLTAKTQPLSVSAGLRKENDELRRRLEVLEGDKHAIAASAFVSKAIDEGRTVADKRKHLESEFVRAEKVKAGSGPASLEPQLFAKGTFTVGRRMTANGNPIGKKDAPPGDLAQESADDVRAQYAAKIRSIMAAEKLSYPDATARVKIADPELYAAFAALGR